MAHDRDTRRRVRLHRGLRLTLVALTFARMSMRELITMNPMPYELSVIKAKGGYITSCFVSTDVEFLKEQGGLSREWIFELYKEGLDWLSKASGFDPRKSGNRSQTCEVGQPILG